MADTDTGAGAGPDPVKPVAGRTAVVSGGASGLGEATARLLVARGARVAILDRDADRAKAVADDLGDAARAYVADVTEPDQVKAAIDGAAEELGPVSAAVICAGVGFAQRTVGRGGPADLDSFSTVIRINLIGTYNVLRLAAAAMAGNEPDETGERGVVVMTASVAAFDGQIGQTAYSASKGGVAAMTLPAARDLSVLGVRVCTIAPGVFSTPMFAGLSPAARDALAAQVPFPPRLGDPREYALLACQIIEHPYLNGEVIRLDAGLRMGPK
jgi:NAD(P)-dependent dehydrogenase (short-subunit alcohol dehydrogenase family)